VVWAVSLSTPDLCTRGLTTGRRIRRFRGLGNGFIHPSLPKSPLPQRWFLTTIRCTTKIVFVENQLSPGSVSFSLLPAAHPMLVQQQRVRSPTLGKFSRRNCTGGGFRASPAHPLSGEVHGHRGLTLGPEGSEEPPGPSPRPPRRRIASLAGQRRIGTTPYTDVAAPAVRDPTLGETGRLLPLTPTWRLRLFIARLWNARPHRSIQSSGGGLSRGHTLRYPQRNLGVSQLDIPSAAELKGPSLGRMATAAPPGAAAPRGLRIRTGKARLP
jgi:hypothetical protein